MSSTELEDNVRSAYSRLKRLDNNKNRLQFYTAVETLAVECLTGMFNKDTKSLYAMTLEDKRLVASDFALYFLELIIAEDFVANDVVEEKMSWTRYISRGLRSTIASSTYSADPIIAVEHLYHGLNQRLLYQHTSYHEVIDENTIYDSTLEINDILEELSDTVYRQLLSFYTEKEVKQLLHLSATYLLFKDFAQQIYEVRNTAPDNIYNFCVLLYCISRRATYKKHHSIKEHPIKEIGEAVKKALRSTLFFASVADTEIFPIPLLAALDMESFYRIIKVAGGRTIRIPTQKELDDTLAYVHIMEKVITEKKSSKQACNSLKIKQGVNADSASAERFVNKVSNTLKETETLTEPLIESLADSLKLVNRLLETVDIDDLKLSNNSAMNYYVNLNTLLNTTLSSLINLKKKHKQEN